MDWIQPSLFGKMSPESCLPRTTLLDVSSALWWEQTNPSFHQKEENGLTQVWLVDPKDEQSGVFSMHNTSESPNDAAESLLSDVLMGELIHRKYFLSPKACTGILRRAEKRGKKLPEMLERALKEGARFTESTKNTLQL